MASTNETSSEKQNPEQDPVELVNGHWGCFFAALAFGLAATAAGVATVYYVILAPMKARKASAGWVETPCVIRESSVSRSTSSNRIGERDSEFFTIDVSYDYQFDGKEYTSDQYDFYEISTGEVEWKEEVVEKIPPGTETVCFVNPDEPSEAVLSRGKNVGFVTAIPGLVFLLAGVASLVAAIFGGMIPKRK